MNSCSTDDHKHLFDTPFHSTKPTGAFFRIAYLFQGEQAVRHVEFDNLIAAVKSPFHLQRDGYNSGVAVGYHAELFAANYRCLTLPVTNNNADILIE